MGQSKVYYILSSISIQSGDYPLKSLQIEDIPTHFQDQVFKRPKLWRNSVSRIFEELEVSLKNLKDNKFLTNSRLEIRCEDRSIHLPTKVKKISCSSSLNSIGIKLKSLYKFQQTQIFDQASKPSKNFNLRAFTSEDLKNNKSLISSKLEICCEDRSIHLPTKVKKISCSS